MQIRVLVVEAESGARNAVCAALEGRGHVCRAVELVDDALLELCYFQPDVVVLDLMRPMARVVLEVVSDLRYGGRPISVVVTSPEPPPPHLVADAVVVRSGDTSELVRAISFARDAPAVQPDA